MNLFVAIGGWNHENENILAICTTEELANRAVEQAQADTRYDYTEVNEYLIDHYYKLFSVGGAPLDGTDKER